MMGGEDHVNCPEDCPPTGTAGATIGTAGATIGTAGATGGGTTGPICGDGCCDNGLDALSTQCPMMGGEDHVNCPEDCPPTGTAGATIGTAGATIGTAGATTGTAGTTTG